MSLPGFSDKAYWEEQLQNYVDCGARSMWDNGGVWDYFKHCIRTQNRFFFQNPLLPVILSRFEQNTFILQADVSVYRARVDHKRECENQCWLAKDLQDIENAQKDGEKSKTELGSAIEEYYKQQTASIKDNPEYQAFAKRQATGFEGFDAEGSGAAPYDKAASGRCNPQNVSYLYAANDPHTAVAEVRPFIRDSVSVATLKPKRDLKLVDFYYQYDKNGTIMITDAFWHKIRCEFSAINKGNTDDYLVTQFISALAQHAGYDGLRFRSSLVYEGTNYVIFDGDICTPISSKMYIIPRVTYELRPIIPE